MNKIVEAMKATGVFYLATIDGEHSRVRPISAVEDINGEVYFCTGNTKDMYKQIMAHPQVEFSGMNKDGSWIRVNGTLVRDDSDESRAKMLELEPTLGNMYHVGDGVFEVLYLKDAKCTKYSFTAAPEEIKA
ncbi:Uncharacterized protein, pyridoxamine 5'-phosphate oxidase (PNPOx-like) family [Butyrivibrio sp. INlla18]|uniref:pyridoxamine 5'-phosphate oxidase family protein n=1 Tax=Butyrivibrio sp. INlla18 TaxID=1520806 RepID=UPI00088FF779|nr:pyridoxamine 5'-phosphate oxidase family protein [Butyrivibrio sp. INlla18]SDA58704.1 Uncharacterized protein, pyridoxamine 5'-phosphate oxidase (PNPOx-like) family [Butyrivibrio sp. INlla18]